jgi:pimeloyl-ACP methyl ester carboxylesterase
MISEKLNKLIEIRPGRTIFTRHWILNDDEEEESSMKTSSRTVNLVCVHGTAASQEQYIPLWKALDSRLSAETSSTLRVHCWAYDAIGCGRSPKIHNNAKAYTDAEQVQDLQELLENHVDSKYDTYFVGHSYGPTWIYKCFLLLQQQQRNEKLSTTLLKPTGLVLISTGLECKELVIGGPAIFRVVPLWLLKCIQPLLTASFLKLGFSPYTHKHDPELIVQAKQANNQNDMQTVIYYYKAHDWLSQLSPESMPPALVLHGTDDEIVPIHCGQQVANQLQTTLIAVTDASHMILMEKPDQVAQHLVDFLQH